MERRTTLPDQPSCTTASPTHIWDQAIEWPTVGLAVAIYAAWLGLTAAYEVIPVWLLFILGGLVAGWHASFQHEATHGHPTPSRRCNTILASPSLLPWLPYRLFEREHQRHHENPALTDPLDDPESFYVLEADWRRMNRLWRGLLLANNTLAGRLIFGPFLVVLSLLWRKAWLIGRGDRVAIQDWACHMIAIAPVMGWLVLVADMPIWLYLVCFVYPGTALLLLRSFIEHRPHDRRAGRTAIVEDSGFFSLLFLNNNLHVVHHDDPGIPWYRLPKVYRARRDQVLRENGGFLFAGYGDIARRYLFRAKDHPIHPARRL
jgi:fatty acid desaturase